MSEADRHEIQRARWHRWLLAGWRVVWLDGRYQVVRLTAAPPDGAGVVLT